MSFLPDLNRSFCTIALTTLFANFVLPLTVTILLSTPLIVAPKMAVAQEGSVSSPLAGVSLPKGATRHKDAGLESGLGRLLTATAKTFNLPAPDGGSGTAEVYFWTGANYRKDRASFVYAQLQNALESTGYTYTQVEAGGAVEVPNAFETETFGTAPLDLMPFDPVAVYFRATNVKKGKTIVGVWFHQETHKRFVLALSECGFAGAPTRTNTPTINDPNVWLVKDLKNATSGMPTALLPAFPKLVKKPGTVRGMVKDSKGKPIVGARIAAYSSAVGGFQTSANGTTNAEGIYEIPLPTGICYVGSAECRINYNGKKLLLPLHPVDGERDKFNSRDGHVENFVLRTSGASTDGVSTGQDATASYGAPMRINFSKIPETGVIEVTLKPTGVLLDGSIGKTLVFRWTVKSAPAEQVTLGGIPIGRYTLTAKVYDGEDTLPIRARKTFRGSDGEEPQLASSLSIEFEGDLEQHTLPGQTNIRLYYVSLQP